MAVALDGSSPSPVYGDTQAVTSLVTASFTPPAGSVVVAKVFSSDGGQTHTTPTGLTFTSRANLGTSGASTRVSLWTAAGAGAAITVTAAFSGTLQTRGLVVEVWTGAQLAATPAVATVDGTAGASAPSLSLTTTAANSVVTWLSNDWNAIDGTATRTYRSSATERAFHFVTGFSTAYLAYQAAAAAGAQTFGLTAPTGQKPTMAGVEIQSSGAAVATPIRRIGKRTW